MHSKFKVTIWLFILVNNLRWFYKVQFCQMNLHSLCMGDCIIADMRNNLSSIWRLLMDCWNRNHVNYLLFVFLLSWIQNNHGTYMYERRFILVFEEYLRSVDIEIMLTICHLCFGYHGSQIKCFHFLDVFLD